MSRSYYVIELSARWLTALLVALALVMMLAFALGYGAAWSVMSGSGPSAGGARTPTVVAAATEIPEVVIPTSPPTATAEPTQVPTVTPTPLPTQQPTPAPTATPAVSEFFVQVLASNRQPSVEAARARLEDLGFSREYQHLIATGDGDDALYRLRIGPFPDRRSADRVAQRMSAAGFPDAWVVAP